MNIGSAAKLSGLTVKSVRYYADIDLVKPAINEKNGYRDYNNNDVAKLGFIGQARKFNFSIRECRDLLSLYEDKNRSNKEVKKLTIEKINEIDQKLNELTLLRKKLSHLADNCKGNGRPDCPILDELSKLQKNHKSL